MLDVRPDGEFERVSSAAYACHLLHACQLCVWQPAAPLARNRICRPCVTHGLHQPELSAGSERCLTSYSVLQGSVKGAQHVPLYVKEDEVSFGNALKQASGAPGRSKVLADSLGWGPASSST